MRQVAFFINWWSLTQQNGHLHRFRDTAATRWLRAGNGAGVTRPRVACNDAEYLEPSKETEKQLEEMKLPF